MRASLETVREERGIALVMAIVMLFVIAAIAVVLMINLQVERKISGSDMRDSQALNTAEAGVNEALSRIRSGEISLDQSKPKAAAQIFLAAAGSVPVLGTDSTALPTAQPAGSWLNYSTANKGGPNVLTVAFKTNSSGTVIYKYDNTTTPSINTVSGNPIYKITSTGVKGINATRIVTEVVAKPIPCIVHGAFAANVPINFSGNSQVCGYDHSGSTPVGTSGRDGIVNANGDCDEYERATGSLPGGWSTSTISTGGSSSQFGTPPTSPTNPQFYAGPWEMFGMGQAEFFQWVGAPVATEPSNPTGIYYLDNNGTTQDQSGSFAYNGGSGTGLLYVDGDMTINGNFNYKGVIYVEGDLKINGTVWILGALVVRGKTTVKLANGNCTVLYSSEAIQQALSTQAGQFVTLSWRQVPLN